MIIKDGTLASIVDVYEHRCSIGAVSTDKEEAIHAMLAVADHLNDGWIPDWENLSEEKYYIYASTFKEGEPVVDCHCIDKCDMVYFKSREVAEEAVRILGKDLINTALS